MNLVLTTEIKNQWEKLREKSVTYTRTRISLRRELTFEFQFIMSLYVVSRPTVNSLCFLLQTEYKIVIHEIKNIYRVV